VVLDVPPTLELRPPVPLPSFHQHLSQAVLLASDRIMPKNELDWENTLFGKLDVMAAPVRQHHPLPGGLPALPLQLIERLPRRTVRKVRRRIHALAEPVVHRRKINDSEVDAVESQLVDPLYCIG